MLMAPISFEAPRHVGLRRELIERISLTARILVLVAVILVAGTAVFIVRSVSTAYEEQQKMLGVNASQSSRVEEIDKQLASIHERIDRIEQQIARPKGINSDLNDSDRSSVRPLALTSKLWTTYGNGICLIAGSYILVEPATGRPLRHPELEEDTAESLLVIGTRQLTYEGKGAIFEQEFEATGFHVGSGYVLTNHHIALEPWAADRRTQFYIESIGAIPRLKHLLAFFPGQRQAIPLTLKSSSKTDDVAVCALQSKTIPLGIPALPLDKESGTLEVGQPVVTMGYPSGPDRLLALLPEQEAVGLMNEHGALLTSLLDQLAKRNLIRPMMTQGHIRDMYKNRIIVDGMITQGSSGTPMFGEKGKVIGVTFAALADDPTSNFAVGVQSAIEQLRIAGWIAPDN